MDAVVTTLVTDLSNGQADLSQAQQFYNQIVGDLSHVPVLCDFVTAPSVKGIVTIPGFSADLLLFFFNNVQLGELGEYEASWVDPNWRVTTGTPNSFVRYSYNQRQLQLLPLPTVDNNCQFLVASTRQTLPAYLQMPIALLILEREYTRESNHKNLKLAKACGDLGNFLLAMITKESGVEATT